MAKSKICLGPDCSVRLTGKQRMFCSDACRKRHGRQKDMQGQELSGFVRVQFERDRLRAGLPRTVTRFSPHLSDHRTKSVRVEAQLSLHVVISSHSEFLYHDAGHVLNDGMMAHISDLVRLYLEEWNPDYSFDVTVITSSPRRV